MSGLQILKDSTESLVVYPPRQYLGHPTAATVRVSTPSTSLPDAGDVATVDSADTTLSATGTRGDDSVTVASATGITAGRRYLVDDNGTRAVVVCRGVSGTTVYLEEPLLTTMASGATFQGLAVLHPLTTDETETSGPGWARWTVTIDGVDVVWDQSFRIVKAVFALPSVTPELLARKEVRRLRGATDETLSEVVDSAWETVLRVKLRARGMLEERINTPDELKPCLIEAVILLLMRAAGESDERVETQEQRLANTLDDVLASSRFWYDEADEDAVVDERDDTSQLVSSWWSR